MNKNLLKLCILGCATVAFNACDTGAYNNLECDESYVAECLSENAYMYCNNGKLDLKNCAPGSMCMHIDGVATCAADGEGGDVPQECTKKCIDETHLNDCVNGQATPVDCSADGKVCEVDACVSAQPQCEASCDADGKLLTCEEDADGNRIAKDCSKDENGEDTGLVCGADANGKFDCVDPASLCEASCDADGKLLTCEKDADGNRIAKDCSKDENGEDTGLVCGADPNGKFDCVEPAQQCVVSCDADGIHLNSCNDEDLAEVIDCSALNDQICGAVGESFGCIAKCTAADNKCDAETETAFVCNETTGIINEIVCPDDDSKVCEVKDGIAGCIARCTADDNKCSDDAMKLLSCNSESGHLEEVVCATEEHPNYQCLVNEDSVPVCDAKASIIGLPCTCEGEDCNSVMTGAQIKALFTENGRTLLSGEDNYFNSIDDADEVVIPNFFANGIKGCEALTNPPEGMKVACYRQTEITFAPSIVDIFANRFPAILKKYSDLEEGEPSQESQNLSRFMTELGAILNDGITFNAADVGYCTYAALNLKINASGLLGYMLEPNAFDADAPNGDAGIAAKFNQGTVAGNAADSDDTCPEGSSYFHYNLNKSFSFIGESTVAFSMCLANCTSNDDCNAGYECIDMNGRYCESDTDANCFDGHVNAEGVFFTSDYYNSGRVFPAPNAEGARNVCFSKEALGGFLALKGKLNQVKAGLIEAAGN